MSVRAKSVQAAQVPIYSVRLQVGAQTTLLRVLRARPGRSDATKRQHVTTTVSLGSYLVQPGLASLMILDHMRCSYSRSYQQHQDDVVLLPQKPATRRQSYANEPVRHAWTHGGTGSSASTSSYVPLGFAGSASPPGGYSDDPTAPYDRDLDGVDRQYDQSKVNFFDYRMQSKKRQSLVRLRARNPRSNLSLSR